MDLKSNFSVSFQNPYRLGPHACGGAVVRSTTEGVSRGLSAQLTEGEIQESWRDARKAARLRKHTKTPVHTADGGFAVYGFCYEAALSAPR